MSDTKQLELFRVVVKPVNRMTPEQQADFERVCAEGRRESAELLAIANELFPDEKWTDLISVPSRNLRPARSEYNRRHGLPSPFWETEGLDAGKDTCIVSSPTKPYKPWSEERKIRNRLRLLHERMEKKWSMVNLRAEELFNAVLRQPQYYGVCPLPGAVESSPITLPNLAREDAIAKEIMLREIESGRLQPVNIPLSIKEPELELATISIQNKESNGILQSSRNPSH